jgi:eukaryotic-like serine/threonine-protein kinase
VNREEIPEAYRDAAHPIAGVGRAQRQEGLLADGSAFEIWLLPRDERGVADELLALCESHIGGFAFGGETDANVWLMRRRGDRTLADALRQGRFDLPRATAYARALATALSRIETIAEKSPPALVLESVSIVDDRPMWMADAWIATRVGGKNEGAIAPRARYTPPAQAGGAAWDHAANRYVLGLILYKMISGEHPFEGAGLRHQFAEAEHREPPPFTEEIASTLPAGFQGLVLRLLAPSAEDRPSSAERVVHELRHFALDETLVSPVNDARRAKERTAERDLIVERSEREQNAPTAKKTRPQTSSIRNDRTSKLLRFALPVAAGLAVAAGAFAGLGPPRANDGTPQKPKGTYLDEPLSSKDTLAQDCASCHPRQTAEWRRSVMGHALTSPLFNSLEMLIQEQVGRDFDCPNGAGILRKTNEQVACRDRNSGLKVSGSGGEHWCINCHAPMENIENRMPAWEGLANGNPRTRLPAPDLVGPGGKEGISCGFCHTTHGPVSPRSAFQGNPSWVSTTTGITFSSRPEDARGLFGISNSGYGIALESLLLGKQGLDLDDGPRVHKSHDSAMKRYLQSSEFCGSCHDVRLFGTDVIGGTKGEHFKRLRNAYSEWVDYKAILARRGKQAATCQDCHMSTFPGVCIPSDDADGDDLCPDGSRFEARAPGDYAEAFAATGSREPSRFTSHYLTGVDLPLSREYPGDLLNEQSLDTDGNPLSPRARRDLLLKRSFRFELGDARLQGNSLTIPVEIENIRAGHRIPAGFSQEREFWVHLLVKDAAGATIYEVGRVDRNDEDLHDKEFVRVNTNPDLLDFQGRPIGLFGADVSDGVDVPRWSPPPEFGGTTFRGRGLINFQNGFLRCVRCIGIVGADGKCQPAPGQERFRADRFIDGAYDQDTGACISNLTGQNALFETYFPVGALNSTQGIPKAPDAIIDTRSAPPLTPLTYTYELDTAGRRGPFTVEASLRFRAFPPFLIRAFAAYESAQAARGKRPGGPLVDDTMLKRLEIVVLARDRAKVGR